MTECKTKKLKEVLTENKDPFSWMGEDMLGIDPSVMSHKLSICKEARPMAQKK